jgi:hypothetical protein
MITILAHKGIRCQDCIRIEDMRPAGSDVEGIDERALVLPYRRLIELIRLLEPRARVVQIHVDGVLGSWLKVHTIKDIF